MRILIVRHGDPDYVNDSLTEKGRREAALLAQKLKKEKLDYIYSSPLGRAKLTCEYTAKEIGREKEVVIKPWLREFDRPVPHAEEAGTDILWDMLPAYWTKKAKMYSADEWYEQDTFKQVDMEASYRKVTEGLDALLKEHGYERSGKMYVTKKGNTDTLIFFCHFGLEMMLLSHLMNISPVILTHHFVAPPTSVTTLYTEERREGLVSFRCAGFGDTGHLYVGGEPVSSHARFCEIYDSDERHD